MGVLLSISIAMAAWVLEPPQKKGRKLIRIAQRHDWRVVDLAFDRWCIDFELDEDEQRKLSRKFESKLISRASCEVARYPKGRGYILAVLSDPYGLGQQPLESYRLDQEIRHWRLRWPNEILPVELCISRMAVANPLAFKADIESLNYVVASLWEVGSCQ